MKTILVIMSLLLASTAQAARSQAECPPDTLWDSSTNRCYLDPNSETAKREHKEQERRERERLRQEAERAAEEQRQKLEMGKGTSDLNPKPQTVPPLPEYINR